MKIKFISLLFLCLLAVITAVSCAGAPATEPAPVQEAAPASPPPSTPAAPPPAAPPPVTPPPPQGLYALSAEELAKLYSDTEEELILARQDALNSGAALYTPDFLLDADNTVAAALQKYQANDLDEAKAAADEALLMYNTLKNGLDAYAFRDLTAPRLEELAPEYLWDADDVGLEMFAKWRDKDYSGAKAAADKALVMFSALNTGVNAYDIREEIAPDAFKIDSNALWQNDNIFNAAVDKWEAGDFAGAKTGVEEALLGYASTGAAVERLRALDARADVAVRQEFNAAQAVYERAMAAGQNYEEAAWFYMDSLRLFRQAAITVEERRQAAEEALRRAQQRLNESDETARNADAILEGGR